MEVAVDAAGRVLWLVIWVGGLAMIAVIIAVAWMLIVTAVDQTKKPDKDPRKGDE